MNYTINYYILYIILKLFLAFSKKKTVRLVLHVLLDLNLGLFHNYLSEIIFLKNF